MSSKRGSSVDSLVSSVIYQLQIFYNLVTELIFSVWLGLTSQSSHVSSEVDWPVEKVDKNNVFHGDW